MKASDYPFLPALEEKLHALLETKERVLVSVVGPRGTGKSRLGKYLRQNGCGRLGRKEITVIDDSVMWTDFLVFFRKRVRLPREGVEEFQKILQGLPAGKRVIFYINNTPWTRISEADILLKLSADDEVRMKRLEERCGDSPEKLAKGRDSRHFDDYRIRYSFFMEEKV